MSNSLSYDMVYSQVQDCIIAPVLTRWVIIIFIFGRPYYQGLSVCRRSSVTFCIVAIGETVRPREKVSEGVNRKPGSKVHFLGRRHISTSSFAATATETAVFVLFLPVQPSNRY